MDFAFTPDDEAFRGEIRAFLSDNVPAGYADQTLSDEETEAARRRFVKVLGAKGWLAVAWPREYGGQGWPPIRQMIFNEEMSLARAPRPAGAGLGLVGPTLISHGTDEQKARHLPGIASGDVLWCQLFSEPNAGSDLAALETSAVEDGDAFVLNGRKIWSSDAHRADWGLILTRTDRDAPKHKGISTFLLDMRLPGITVAPIETMLRDWRAVGAHNFSEVLLEDVRVPRDCLVGEKDRGWYQAIAGLESERSNLAATVSLRRFLEELLAHIRASPTLGKRLRKLGLEKRIAQVAIDLQVMRSMGYAIVGKQMAGLPVSRDASLAQAVHERPGATRRGRGHAGAGPRRPVRTGREARSHVGPGRAPLSHQCGLDHRRGHIGDPAQHHRHTRPGTPLPVGPRWRPHRDDLPLSPYRVIDLTGRQGALCGRILGDLGADVIKVEPPGGDPARGAWLPSTATPATPTTR